MDRCHVFSQVLPGHARINAQPCHHLCVLIHFEEVYISIQNHREALVMASRAVSYWRCMASRRWLTTATAPPPRMKPAAEATAGFMDHHAGSNKRAGLKGEFIPVCVALGMIILALSIAGHTAKQQLMHSPGVRVSKKKREMVVEVEDPDRAAGEADRFVSKSILRKVAHLQDLDAARSGTSDPTRPDPYNYHRTLVTLKSVGVNSGNN